MRHTHIFCVEKNSAKVYPNGFGFWLQRRKLWEKVHLGEIPNYFLLSNRENECLDECNYELAVLLLSFSVPKAKWFLLLLSGLFFRHITQRIFNEGRQQKRVICWHESSCVEKKMQMKPGKRTEHKIWAHSWLRGSCRYGSCQNGNGGGINSTSGYEQKRFDEHNFGTVLVICFQRVFQYENDLV